MSTFARIVLGLMGIGISLLVMKYTVSVTAYTGKIDFAQKYLRPGFAGTYTYWRLIALGLFILSILFMFNIINFSYLNLGPTN